MYNFSLFRDEVGTCSITYSEESGTTIDAFALLAPPSAPATAGESTVGKGSRKKPRSFFSGTG